MPVLTENRGAGAYLLSEVDHNLSRDVELALANAAAIEDGTIMGKVTASSKLVPWDPDAVDGSEDAYAILLGRLPISAEDTNVVVTARLAVVNEDAIIYHPDADAGDKAAAKAALLAKNIKVLANS